MSNFSWVKIWLKLLKKLCFLLKVKKYFLCHISKMQRNIFFSLKTRWKIMYGNPKTDGVIECNLPLSKDLYFSIIWIWFAATTTKWQICYLFLPLTRGEYARFQKIWEQFTVTFSQNGSFLSGVLQNKPFPTASSEIITKSSVMNKKIWPAQ